MTDAVPPGFWTRDDTHSRGPMGALMESVWCEPYTRGFAEAFARWGYLGDGLAGVVIGGWFYTGFRPLSDAGLVPVRIARAAEAAAADEHLTAARDWTEIDGPGFERRRRRLAEGDPPAVDEAARLVRDVVRGRFATIGVHELVVEWVLQAQERRGWAAERALALAAPGPAGFASASELAGLLDAVATVPALRERLDAGRPLALAELTAEPHVAKAFSAYLDRHGDLLLELDIASPTLAERPEHVAVAVAAAWSRGVVRIAEAGPDDEAGPDEAGPDDALRRARIAYPVRDDGNELMTRCLGTLRRAALAAGTRLGLDDPEEALLCTAEELAAAARYGALDRDLLADRRAAHRHALAHRPPAVLGDPPPPPPDPATLPDPVRRAMRRVGLFVELMNGAPPAGTGGLTGVPASAGRYAGPVRIAGTADEAHDILGGEVLVCPVTGPAWNLAMMRAGALVCDAGGQLSHAAITARELGIPAVVGCAGATATLRTGDRVVVDGAAGTVTRGRPSASTGGPRH